MRKSRKFCTFPYLVLHCCRFSNYLIFKIITKILKNVSSIRFSFSRSDEMKNISEKTNLRFRKEKFERHKAIGAPKKLRTVSFSAPRTITRRTNVNQNCNVTKNLTWFSINQSHNSMFRCFENIVLTINFI